MQTAPQLDEQLTDQIGLRSAQTEDAAGLFCLIEADRAYLDEWIPWVGAIRSAMELQAIIRDRQSIRDGIGPAFCMLYEDSIAGWFQFRAVPEQPRSIELETWIGAAYQGRWIPSICGRRLVRYAFEELGRERVVACAAVGNRKSALLLERSGFAEKRLLENADRIHGRDIDLMLYAVERP